MLPTSLLSNDFAANIAFFLLAKSGSIFGRWSGSLRASDQRTLFGRYLGRGRIVIDGATETVSRYVTVCFGTDFDCRDTLSFREL